MLMGFIADHVFSSLYGPRNPQKREIFLQFFYLAFPYWSLNFGHPNSRVETNGNLIQKYGRE